MKKLTYPALALLVASSLSLTACGRGGGGDEFLNAIPTADDLRINVPEGEQALALGETSEMYEMTYNVSRFLNGAVGAVFVVMGAIVLSEPTVEEENLRVWGPSEPRGLERKSWRFTVEKTDDNTFEYKLEGRDRGSEAEEDFQTVWSGVSHPGEENVGDGTLNLHFDADDDDCSTGTAIVTYDATSEIKYVDIDFDGVRNSCDEDEGKVQSYHYAEDSEGAGDFLFSLKGNIHDDDENKPEEETLTIKSRWMASGVGRSDVILTSSEIEADLAEHLPESGATDVTISECWNELFELTYTDTAPEELRGFLREPLGEEADCPFQEAAFPDEVEEI